MTFVVATNNAGKVREFERILSMHGHRCITLDEAGIDCKPKESGSSFDENAEIKARAVFDKCAGKYAVVADDSGLCVDALDGAPGIFSARYAGDDAANCRRLLAELGDTPWQDRGAEFRCCICAILPDGEVIFTHGRTRGTIGFEARGENGFGYDPLFYGYNNFTFAEMTNERKNNISHRARALGKLSFILRGVKHIKTEK